jgi:hypothetical protein
MAGSCRGGPKFLGIVLSYLSGAQEIEVQLLGLVWNMFSGWWFNPSEQYESQLG